jgi:hypothetical protein
METEVLIEKTTLTEACYQVLNREIELKRVRGLEDIASVKLLNGEDGGGIRVYQGDKNVKVTLVDFKLGEGVPVPHHDNRLCVGAEIFQISPDLTCKLPGWGINSVIMKDGYYYFDTDFSFGFDLVMDYGYVMKYIAPFNETYQKYTRDPAFEMVTYYESTPWVRTYASPLFFSAIAKTDNLDSVYNLAADLIRLWLTMFRDAEQGDQVLKVSQAKRLKAKNEGSKNSDRMGKVLFGAYGKETFAKFFKAMT